MNENKKRHYPKDRAKLHALLDKREQSLAVYYKRPGYVLPLRHKPELIHYDPCR